MCGNWVTCLSSQFPTHLAWYVVDMEWIGGYGLRDYMQKIWSWFTIRCKALCCHRIHKNIVYIEISPGENFRQFRHLLSLAIFLSR